MVEENEVQPDSLDECYLAASVGHHLAGSCHPYTSASFSTERREVCLALDVNGEYSQTGSEAQVDENYVLSFNFWKAS